jgi:cob(I)alamin adenosyltransferase
MIQDMVLHFYNILDTINSILHLTHKILHSIHNILDTTHNILHSAHINLDTTHNILHSTHEMFMRPLLHMMQNLQEKIKNRHLMIHSNLHTGKDIKVDTILHLL